MAKSRKKLTEEERERICALRKEGHTTFAISEIVNRTVKSICNVLRENDMSTERLNLWSESDEALLIKMFNEDVDYKVIGEELHRTRASVNQHIHNLRLRGKLGKRKCGRKKKTA